ncbi:host cell division inhibitor Icd-like protein [Klebsiella huaxiensis]
MATPRSAGTLPRRLTKPLVEVTVMAGSQHTQTHPEFTWRFLSTSERYPAAKPLVIYVNASSEQKARSTMPGVNLIFAARLPFHALQVTGGRV